MVKPVIYEIITVLVHKNQRELVIPRQDKLVVFKNITIVNFPVQSYQTLFIFQASAVRIHFNVIHKLAHVLSSDGFTF